MYQEEIEKVVIYKDSQQIYYQHRLNDNDIIVLDSYITSFEIQGLISFTIMTKASTKT